MRLIIVSFFVLGFLGISFSQETSKDGNLPDRFPVLEILESNSPADGLIFVAPMGEWGSFQETDPYIAIYDNFGTPVFFQEQSMRAFDFKLQENGLLTYYGGTLGYPHHAINKRFEYLRDYHLINVPDDFHEFIMLEDSSYFMLGLDSRVVDMDTIVEGGHKGVVVDGNAVQYFNRNDSLLFEWNTWDHFSILDVNDYIVDLTDPDHIDWVHANSIEKDTDTSILLSCRNMDEITRINLNTGEIIWRMGGKQNMFAFENDTCFFHMQHDVRKLPDGNISVHDNNYPDFIDHSRAVVYKVDEVNMSVDMVASYPQNYPGFDQGLIMGNSQFQEDSSVFICWGSGKPNIREFHPDGSTALVLDYGSVSYRAFKYDWKPSALTLSHDILYFETIKPGDTKSLTISIYNNRATDATINYLHSHSDEFTVSDELPFTVAAGSSKEITIDFKSETKGTYKDVLTICWDFVSEGFNNRIATQLNVNGVVDEFPGIDEDLYGRIKVYPNPVTDRLMVDPLHFRGNIQNIRLVNSTGQVLLGMEVKGKSVQKIPTSDIKSGMYFLIIKTNKGQVERKVIRY